MYSPRRVSKANFSSRKSALDGVLSRPPGGHEPVRRPCSTFGRRCLIVTRSFGSAGPDPAARLTRFSRARLRLRVLVGPLRGISSRAAEGAARDRCAVFFADPRATPGTLSELSPMSARTSMTCSGRHTELLDGRFVRVDDQTIVRVLLHDVVEHGRFSLTSCMKSLSPVTIRTSNPSASARSAKRSDHVVGLESRGLLEERDAQRSR